MRLNQKTAKKLRIMAKHFSNQFILQDQGKTLTVGYFELKLNRHVYKIPQKNGSTKDFTTVGTLFVHDKSEKGFYKALKKKLRKNDF